MLQFISVGIIQDIKVGIRICGTSFVISIPPFISGIEYQSVPVKNFQLKAGHKHIVYSITIGRKYIGDEGRHITISSEVLGIQTGLLPRVSYNTILIRKC
jgi:hypothetical protein